MADERAGVNGALAAALTRAVGSMPALYAVTVFMAAWMALATWGPVRQVDPYPFPFLLFLGNAVQLVLCSVILVGQRVLGVAADRRSVQTYENTEAIFRQVADLQAHLDRHDQALSRGLSLLDTSPHPWVQRHRVQPPPQAVDQVTGANGRIAAWMTQRLGSMWAFYAAAGIQVAWIVLAEAGVQRFDPYPFAFMTFLSSLAQLIFMITIMVGQDVLGGAGDRRSEQTYLDAEAIVHESGRMKARLTAQDRVIATLAGYAASQVTENLARAVHQTAGSGGPDSGRLGRAWHRAPAGPPGWEDLPEEAREAYRMHAWRLGERLAAIGCLMVPASGAPEAFAFTGDEAGLLAQQEHDSWLAEPGAPGDAALGDGAPGDDASGEAPEPGPESLPWDQLPGQARARKIDDVHQIPGLLAGVGFRVLREGVPGSGAGPGEADFTEAEWAALQRPLMATGVLVALAEGAAEADEIYALVRTLRAAGIGHRSRLVRELAATSAFETGLRPGTGYSDYEPFALDAVRSAVALLSRRSPSGLPAFRGFLDEITAAVADANNEGGFFGLGARPRTPSEAAAMDAVSAAAGSGSGQPQAPQPSAARRLTALMQQVTRKDEDVH
jgi:uncharacterized membrane protein